MNPQISIVIPTHSRPTQLKACLDGISRLDCDPKIFETVVVDDGGAASLDDVVAEHCNRFALRLIVRKQGGPALARNDGAQAARGRFLAFIDDDCIPSAGWLSSILNELERRPDCLFGGSVINGLPNNPYSTATQRIATYVQQYQDSNRCRERFYTTNNLAMATERFRELGGFTSSIPSATAEDKEFCDRWRSHGYAMAYVSCAVVYHAHDLTFLSFVRQHYNYGRGIFVYRLIRRGRGARNLVPEPFSFYWNLILFALRESVGRRTGVDLGLMMVSQFATLAGALHAALMERPTICREPSLTRQSGSEGV